jgi:pimeloyl-ACP methyl ester carboxylesterase
LSKLVAILVASLVVWIVAADRLPRKIALAAPAIVPCSDITTLRDLSSSVRASTNTRTGDVVEYLLIGDAASSNQILVFFNGTSQIIPDWPTQMITNAASSPLITLTAIYSASEDGPISLCHNYRLLFFDYPAVGLSASSTNYSIAQVSNDVDALLADVGSTFSIPTNDVSIVGWSLGTLNAMKYATLSPVASPGRIIHNILLIATKPGGGQQLQTNGNGAQCIDGAFSVLIDPNTNSILRTKLIENNFDLLFPYIGEPQNNGPSINCTVTVDTSTNSVSLNVTPNCAFGTVCEKTFAEWTANRLKSPWSITQGVSTNLLIAQREQAHDIDYGYCPAAGPNFTPIGCTSSQPPEQSILNGSECITNTPPALPNQPAASGCVPLTITGGILVINGYQDLYIQHTYGDALVQGYQNLCGSAGAMLDTYPGSDGAGHGVLLQHPGWVQAQIAMGLTVGTGSAAPVNCGGPCASSSPLPSCSPSCNTTPAPANCISACTSANPPAGCTITCTSSGGSTCPVAPGQSTEQPVGYGYCYPAANAPPPGAPCTPFTGTSPPLITAAAGAVAVCQTLPTLAQQQTCIATVLGNVGGFISPLGTGPQPKPPAQRPSGRYCLLPDGARVWVVDGAPVPAGASC